MEILANINLEKYVIGMLLADHTTYHDMRAIVSPDDFYTERWRIIYQAIGDMIDTGIGVDHITVGDELNRRGVLGDLGGMAALTETILGDPSFTLAFDYARQVADYARLRRAVALCTEAVQAAHNTEHETALEKLTEVLTSVQAAVSELDRGNARTLRDIVMRVTQEIEDRANGRGTPSIKTGLLDFDTMARGFVPGELIILAGRPSMGKSSMIATWATHMAESGHQPAVLSLEMSEDQYARRLIAAKSGINSQALRDGNIPDHMWPDYLHWSEHVSNLNMHVVCPAPNMPSIHAALAPLVHRGCDIAMIDYAQLVTGRPGASRYELITEISGQFKALARTLRIPIVLGSQLSRAVEQRTNKRPILSDLRESGALEQDADQVHFLYRDDYYDPACQTPGITEIITAKNRDGATGTTMVLFIRERTWFVNLSKIPIL